MKTVYKLGLTLALLAGAANAAELNKEILNELRQIRQLLEKGVGPDQPAAVIRAQVATAKAFAIGSKDAPVTMVEFTDFQCPFCQRFHTSTFGDLKRQYIDTGKIRFVSRDLPLDMHPNAMQAAEAGRCAGEQQKFWPMRDWMGSHPDQLDIEHLTAYAGELELDRNRFRTCIETGKYKSLIQADAAEARKIGATGAPTFLIGKTTADVIEGELVVGALPVQSFAEKFQQYSLKEGL